MVALTVGNSLSHLSGLSVAQFKALRELMSYTVEGSYFAGNVKCSKRYLLDKKGTFPTGLLYIAEGYLKAHLHCLYDLRRRPVSQADGFALNLPVTAYPEQLATALAFAQADRGIGVAPTGLGKSVIAAQTIALLKVPTLVVVPGLELKRQLTATLGAVFPDGSVGGLGSLIAVENVDALDCTKPLVGYDAIIIDEFHHAAAATYRKLNQKSWGNVYYRFGLTATPFRANDSERLLLESVLSKVVYRIEHKDAVANGRIVPIEAYYYDLPPTPGLQNCRSWPKVYSELVVNNDYRNKLIAWLMNRLFLENAKTLCLVKEIKHGETLSHLTGAPFANGQDGNTRLQVLEFNVGDTRGLIGTTGVIGEGVDTKPAEWVILAAGGKSKNQFMQGCGRGFRIYPGKESCKIVMFRDASHKFTLKHFNACVKFLKEEYGCLPVKLPLPDLS